jgi:hypothetical protein
MIALLSKHYDTNIYGLGKMKLKTYAKALGLTSTRSQGHTFDTIAQPIAELREKFPIASANTLCTYLWSDYNMHVSRYVILQRSSSRLMGQNIGL